MVHLPQVAALNFAKGAPRSGVPRHACRVLLCVSLSRVGAATKLVWTAILEASEFAHSCRSLSADGVQVTLPLGGV